VVGKLEQRHQLAEAIDEAAVGIRKKLEHTQREQ
jgi:hypothetical protein